MIPVWKKLYCNIYKKLDTGKPVYELNEKILMHPASVQKLLTLPAAIDVLGEDYEFTTSVYKRSDDSFVIKLGADPYLTSKDLKNLVNNISVETTRKVFIDDSILEKKTGVKAGSGMTI